MRTMRRRHGGRRHGRRPSPAAITVTVKSCLTCARVPSVACAIASIGLGEAEARQRFANVKVRHEQASGFGSRRLVESVYGYKTLADGDMIPGAHLAGPPVEQGINLFAPRDIARSARQPVLDTARCSPIPGGIRRGLHARLSRRSGGQREAVHLPAGRDHGAPQA